MPTNNPITSTRTNPHSLDIINEKLILLTMISTKRDIKLQEEIIGEILNISLTNDYNIFNGACLSIKEKYFLFSEKSIRIFLFQLSDRVKTHPYRSIYLLNIIFGLSVSRLDTNFVSKIFKDPILLTTIKTVLKHIVLDSEFNLKALNIEESANLPL